MDDREEAAYAIAVAAVRALIGEEPPNITIITAEWIAPSPAGVSASAVVAASADHRFAPARQAEAAPLRAPDAAVEGRLVPRRHQHRLGVAPERAQSATRTDERSTVPSRSVAVSSGVGDLK
jgi:hypothetical protein